MYCNIYNYYCIRYSAAIEIVDVDSLSRSNSVTFCIALNPTMRASGKYNWVLLNFDTMFVVQELISYPLDLSEALLGERGRIPMVPCPLRGLRHHRLQIIGRLRRPLVLLFFLLLNYLKISAYFGYLKMR